MNCEGEELVPIEYGTKTRNLNVTIVLSESKTEQRLKVHVECRRRQHEEERNGLEGGNFACGATKKPKSAHRMAR